MVTNRRLFPSKILGLPGVRQVGTTTLLPFSDDGNKSVEPADPVVFISMSAVLMLAAIGAGWIPSRRASRVNVVRALRAE